MCACEREGERGNRERENETGRGGKEGGGSPGTEKHHFISLTPQELSKEQEDV